MPDGAVVDALLAGAWLGLGADVARAARRAPARAVASTRLPTGPARVAAGLLLLAAALACGTALERRVGRWGASTDLVVVGLALVAAGVALHIAARRVLGPAWSSAIEAPADGRLVERGPYALLRHPLYLAVLLLAAGSTLAHPSLATACAAIGLAAGVAVKIRLEDATLAAALGGAWRTYAARVPALVPRASALGTTLGAGLRRLGRALGPQRRRYALWLGAMLWAGWLVSVAVGPGPFDLAGEVKGADFLEFYTAGRLVLSGRAERLYDLPLQAQVEHAITGGEWRGFHGFLNPPFFALPFVPLALLPYRVAFACWTVLGVVLALATPRLTGRPRAWPWVLAFVPAFASVSFGQNALPSLFLLAGTHALLVRGRDGSAGLVLGLLLYKPQLVGVVALALLLERRWRAVAGVAASGAALTVAALAVSPAAVVAWTRLGRTLVAMPTFAGFPTWNMHSLPAFFLLLLPSHEPAARILGALASIAVLVWMRRTQPRYAPATLSRWFAVAVAATVLASPHLFLYDLTLLVLPALLCWPATDDDAWAGGAALVWVATVFSGPIVRAMQTLVGPAFQLSVPVILAVAAALLPRERD